MVNLGVALSFEARNELQDGSKFIPLVLLPQVFLSGLFWPVSNALAAVAVAFELFPMTYAVRALREAHRRTGDLLKRLDAKGRSLRDLTADEWAAEGVPDGAALLDPDHSIAARPGPGGPSTASVLVQCDALDEMLGPKAP